VRASWPYTETALVAGGGRGGTIGNIVGNVGDSRTIGTLGLQPGLCNYSGGETCRRRGGEKNMGREVV
jgi:hypothetical protein